jgi:hypothetical protein
MIKARTFVAAAALAAMPLAMSATAAFASTGAHHSSRHHAHCSHARHMGHMGHMGGTFFDKTQTLAGQQATFIQGGSDLGRGAAELVSSAYLGGPQGIIDIPAALLGLPKPIMYVP